MVGHARVVARALAFVVWSSLVYVAWLVSGPLLGLVSRRAKSRWQAIVCRTWARVTLRCVGVRVTTVGRPPPPPFVLVSNHLGYLDIVVLMSLVPAVFVSRADVAHWPFLGVLAKAASTIFIDRSSRRDVVRVNQLIQQVLDQGRGLVMFPEGTSSKGDEVLPFRSSLLEPAARIGHPVRYASLGYRTPDGCPPAGLAVCWWGDMTFLDHFLGMLRLPTIQATVTFGPDDVRAEDRHELARSLWHAVARQFTPLPALEARWA